MPTEVRRNVDLSELSSFRLPARARELATLTDPANLPALLDTELEVLVLGGGSNTLFVGDFDGRIVLNRLRGRQFTELDSDTLRLEAAAGEDWQDLVRAAVERELWGIENLALIPGSAGAAPMQNIGAYGVELGDVLESVDVFDRQSGRRSWRAAEDCALGYRSSCFKGNDRYVLLGIRLRLAREGAPRLDYPALAEVLSGEAACFPSQIAEAVTAIRRSKLPDPAELANAGSFFKNPVVDAGTADRLRGTWPDLPAWPVEDGVKLSAAWLIDRLGWRGHQVGGARVYARHALVLTNTGTASGADVLDLARAIRASVQERYGVTLDPEPRLVGGTL